MILNTQQSHILQFVMNAHGEQKRKYTNELYWMHPYAVAEIVSKYTQRTGSIEIALCHDLYEDTFVTYEELKSELNRLHYSTIDQIFILNGVEALTDILTSEKYTHMNRKERKSFEAHRLGKIHGDFQTIKYADLIHNTQSIVEHDKNFAKVYIAEKREMLNLMRNGQIDLFVECYKSLIEAEQKLNN